MTPRILPTVGFTLLASVFSLPSYPNGGSQDEGCNKSSFKGAYGFSGGGTILGGSYAELGRETADGKGKLRGRATQSFEGVIQTVNFRGTYVVNSDCTGTATLAADAGTTATTFMGSAAMNGTHAFVIMDGGEQVDYLFTVSGTVVTGSGHKITSGDDGEGDDDDGDDDDGDDDGDGHDGQHSRERNGRIYGPRRY